MKLFQTPKRNSNLIYSKGKWILTFQFLVLRWSLIGAGKVEERDQLLLPEEQGKSCPTLKSKGLDSCLVKIGFGLWTLLWTERVCDCHMQILENVGFKRSAFLLQFFLLMPLCHSNAAFLSASQLPLALFLQCLPLQTSPVVCEHCLLIAML